MVGFVRGAGYLARGFSMWRRRPGLMLLGMVPAAVVFAVLLTAFVLLVLHVGDLAAWATPFADDWGGGATVVRALLVVGLLLGALVLSSAVFVGLTLAVGDPFYEKIWKETERMLGGDVPDAGPGLLKAAADGLVLALVGVGAALLLLVVSLVPVVGAIGGLVLGLLVAGRFLAGELVSRPLEARGHDRHARAAILADHRSTVLGFGVAAQAFFLVPLAAIVMMPAAVVGATYLARDVLDARVTPDDRSVSGR